MTVTKARYDGGMAAVAGSTRSLDSERSSLALELPVLLRAVHCPLCTGWHAYQQTVPQLELPSIMGLGCWSYRDSLHVYS